MSGRQQIITLDHRCAIWKTVGNNFAIRSDLTSNPVLNATAVVAKYSIMASSPSGTVSPNIQHPTSRGSSLSVPACRRPKLMRSSATAPCVATSNACRNDLASLHSGSGASTLLTKVASYSVYPQNHELRVPSSRRRSNSPGQRSHSPRDHDQTPRRQIGYPCVNGTFHGQ